MLTKYVHGAILRMYKGGEYMVAEKDKEDCKKFADIIMSLPEDSKNMVIIYLSALRDREEADKARLQKT